MTTKQLLKPSYKLNRLSLPEALAESLRERILNGEFKEGDALVQETIAAEYEVSRMPVREAIRQLEASGLVVTKMHKGAFVNSIPVDQISELFELRALLECEIFAHAIPRMNSAHISTAQNVLGQLEDAYHRKDIKLWGKLNWEFHRSLYVPAERVQTLQIIQGINVQTDRYIRLQLLLTEALEEAERDHKELLQLAIKGDVERGVEKMREHIQTAGKNLVSVLKKGHD
ncbi:TPA: GntR family transcriptional regulator [Klebsiella pneumoniae]|nr:GntR family transcriptional regulator [Klebsiella pneumoniae]